MAHNLIESDLTNRKQFVEIDGIKSNILTVNTDIHYVTKVFMLVHYVTKIFVLVSNAVSVINGTTGYVSIYHKRNYKH